MRFMSITSVLGTSRLNVLSSTVTPHPPEELAFFLQTVQARDQPSNPDPFVTHWRSPEQVYPCLARYPKRAERSIRDILEGAGSERNTHLQGSWGKPQLLSLESSQTAARTGPLPLRPAGTEPSSADPVMSPIVNRAGVCQLVGRRKRLLLRMFNAWDKNKRSRILRHYALEGVLRNPS
jgi:hypothetical protein